MNIDRRENRMHNDGEIQPGLLLFEPTNNTINGKEKYHDHSKLWTRMQRKVWVAAMFVGCSMIYASRQTLPICVSAMSQQYKWTKSQTGSALSSFFWGYTLTQLPGGLLSDQYGGATVLSRGALAWCSLTMFLPVVVGLTSSAGVALVTVFILRGMLGLTQGFHYPSITSLFSHRISANERSFSYAFATSGSQFGTMFAGSVGSLLLEIYGWPSVFYFVGSISLAWLAAVWLWLLNDEEDKWRSERQSLDDRPAAAAPVVPWNILLRKPAFWSILICHFTSNSTFFILLSWLPTYFHETFPAEKSWIFNLVPWAFAIPTKWCAGLVADRLISNGCSTVFVRKLMETLSVLLVSACLITVAHITSYHLSLTCMALALAGSTLHTSAVIVNPQDIAPLYAGSVYGVMNTAGSVPGLLGVYLVGYILEATHSWTLVFVGSALVSVAGWAVFLLYGEGRPIVD